MNKERFLEIKQGFSDTDAQGVLSWALQNFDNRRLAFASSLGAEDQVITHMLKQLNAAISIFTIDTGHLYPETRELIKRTQQRYGFEFDVLKPDEISVQEMIARHGEQLFYKNLELRKLCCSVRKLAPLQKKMAGLDAWICGLRREQSVTRTAVEKVEWDETFQAVKINPLADWTERQAWDFIRRENVPYHKLHDQGYPSIGCAPCTRATAPGEDVRAGRWWWEHSQNRECGLHKRGTGTKEK